MSLFPGLPALLFLGTALLLGASSAPFSDLIDTDSGKLLTVAVLHFVAFSPLLFEYGHFIPFSVLDDLPLNGHPFHGGSADLHFPIIIGEQDLVEGDFIPFLRFELIDHDPLVFLHLVLVASDLYNSVHDRNLS